MPRSPTGPGPRKSGPSTRIARLYPARHDCRCSARQYVGSAFCRQQAVPRSGCRNSARVRRPCPGWAQDSDLPRRPGRPYRRGMRLRGNAQATPRQPRSVTPSPCTPTAPQARAPDPAGRKNQGNPRAGSLPPDGQALRARRLPPRCMPLSLRDQRQWPSSADGRDRQHQRPAAPSASKRSSATRGGRGRLSEWPDQASQANQSSHWYGSLIGGL